MILRTLERQPWKSLLSILGIAMAVAVLVLGSFGLDAINYVIELQFHVAQRQDVTVTLVEPSEGAALYDLGHLPGVRHAEPFRSVPVRLRFGHHDRRLGIQGVARDNALYRILDIRGKLLELPEDGLVLSAKLAEILNVEVGQKVTVEVLEGERPIREVPVAGLVHDFAGVNAYMNLAALNRLMQEGNVVSGAFLAVDAKALPELYKTLKNTPRVASITVKEAAVESFRQTIAENLLRMRFFNILFATIIAFGVVYNSARIALSERSRELATLRVIGFTRGEVSLIFLGELAVLTLVAVPLGLVLGYGFAALTTLAYDTELFRIPLVIDKSTFGFAALVVLAAAFLSGLVVRRRIDRLDLVAVLKSKD
jgi:putative ABC transport system permease protein